MLESVVSLQSSEKTDLTTDIRRLTTDD